jgi:hypothetical protein
MVDWQRITTIFRGLELSQKDQVFPGMGQRGGAGYVYTLNRQIIIIWYGGWYFYHTQTIRYYEITCQPLLQNCAIARFYVIGLYGFTG